ncbi:MAG TPA: type IV pilus assembly protein PilM [Candidatus Saccharimonadales bacterium]|nr:type IV pilus assembly protein PilM [Candidatus Saccharimonadales bacterium]
MPIIGLDLGRHNFRAIELDKEKGKPVLLKYGNSENPKVNLDNSGKEDIQLYSNALKQFLVESGFTTSNVVVALPESLVFMRVIKTPNMNEKDLKNFIQYEAEQYIPLPAKEVNLSHQILDIDPLDKGKMNVQLVAAKKSTLEKYIEIIKGAKLTPKALEPETLAIARILGDAEDHPSASLILNLGFSSTLIIITYKGYVRFTRTLTFGGEALTKSIQQDLSLDYTQAEEYKKTYGLDSSQADGKIFNVLKPLFDNIILEIKKSRIFFTTQNPNVNINRVILSGGTALMPGLLFYMANNLDLEVELSNPWKNIQLSGKLSTQKDLLIQQGPLFATCAGLALKEL